MELAIEQYSWFCLALQEHQLRSEAKYDANGLLVVRSDADSGGSFGCETIFRKSVVARQGQTSYDISLTALQVVVAEPRLLIVTVPLAGTLIAVVNFHAPWCSRPHKLPEARHFWKHLKDPTSQIPIDQVPNRLPW